VAAEELATPGEQVEAELSAALAAGNAARAVPLLAEAAEIHRHPCTPEEAQALLELIGRAARSGDRAIAAGALRALGRTGAPAAAAHLEPFLRAPRKGEEGVIVAAVGAAGKLAAEGLLGKLTDLARDCPDLVVAEQALLALGGYAGAGRDLRERAFREALQLAQSLAKQPARWRRLQWPALRALQRLSGRRLNSVPQFADWWLHAKTRKDPFG
jgi:hypothetical protein